MKKLKKLKRKNVGKLRELQELRKLIEPLISLRSQFTSVIDFLAKNFSRKIHGPSVSFTRDFFFLLSTGDSTARILRLYV